MPFNEISEVSIRELCPVWESGQSKTSRYAGKPISAPREESWKGIGFDEVTE